MTFTLLTGAAGGIGRSFATSLAAPGVNLVLLDVDDAGLAATADLVRPSCESVQTATLDVGNREQLESSVGNLVAAPHGIDLLINCAAILGPGNWTTQSPGEFERVLRVDLMGTVNTVRAALPALGRARGQVVILASTAALHGWPQMAAYSAAKFALVGYSEAIRNELAKNGIGITVVFPLLIDTPLLNRPGLPPILRRGRRIPPDAVVKKVLRAVSRRKRRVYVPGGVRFVAAMQGLAPRILDWYGDLFGTERR